MILIVKELIVALLGIELKLNPLKYIYLFDVEEVVFVIVAYVELVVSVSALSLLLIDSCEFGLYSVVGVSVIVAIKSPSLH